MDECKETITQCGYSENDFSIQYTDKSTIPDPKDPAAQYFIMGEVSVTKNSTQKQKEYETGHGSSWPTQLEMDLLKGYFN